MKPAPFEYFAPTSVTEALEKLAELGYNGKVLAGGQSLIPAMNFRMAQPAALVDLNGVGELFFIKPAPDGGLLIGTMTRDSKVEDDPAVFAASPIIRQALWHIAHRQIRNRGTFGGAMAHADPAGQLPGVACATNMRFHIKSKSGERWVDADDFFMGPFSTVIEPEEILYEVHIPARPPRTGMSYQQVSRQQGSQSQVGVATMVTLDEKGRIKTANIALLAVGERPIIARQAAKVLIGQIPSDEALRTAADISSTHEIDPGTDIHATTEYRRHVAGVLVRRTLAEAIAQARG